MADLRTLAAEHGIAFNLLLRFAEDNADRLQLDIQQRFRLLGSDWPDTKVSRLLEAWRDARPPLRATMSSRVVALDSTRPVVPVDFEEIRRESMSAGARAAAILAAKADAERATNEAVREREERIAGEQLRARQARERVKTLEKRLATVICDAEKLDEERQNLELELSVLCPRLRPEPVNPPEERLFDLSM